MYCNCIKLVSKQMEGHAKAKLPPGGELKESGLVELSLCMSEGNFDEFTASTFAYSYAQPKKKGDGVIKKKGKATIRHTYCPFCGLHVETGEPASGIHRD